MHGRGRDGCRRGGCSYSRARERGHGAVAITTSIPVVMILRNKFQMQILLEQMMKMHQFLMPSLHNLDIVYHMNVGPGHPDFLQMRTKKSPQPLITSLHSQDPDLNLNCQLLHSWCRSSQNPVQPTI